MQTRVIIVMQVFSACSWIDMKEITATNDLVTVNQDHVSLPTRETNMIMILFLLMANFISLRNQLYDTTKWIIQISKA